jgi:hypothetical protein
MFQPPGHRLFPERRKIMKVQSRSERHGSGETRIDDVALSEVEPSALQAVTGGSGATDGIPYLKQPQKLLPDPDPNRTVDGFPWCGTHYP